LCVRGVLSFPVLSFCFFHAYGPHPALLSFPTRRSSDLLAAGLDALGDRDLALAREQFDGAHLAQIHAHGIVGALAGLGLLDLGEDRKSTRLNSSHVSISYAVFCLKKKTHPA